jgi:hypothetical protein
VVWQRMRSAAEARSLESSVIEPAAAQLAAELSVSDSDTTSRQALASLVALYATTPQLQATYRQGGKVDIKALLTWAAGAGPDSTMYGAAVEPDVATYQALRSKAASDFSALPVITTQ